MGLLLEKRQFQDLPLICRQLTNHLHQAIGFLPAGHNVMGRRLQLWHQGWIGFVNRRTIVLA